MWFVLLVHLTGNTGVLFWELKGILGTAIPDLDQDQKETLATFPTSVAP